MRTVILAQARTGSSRLPGKVLMDLAGMPLMGWTVRAAKAVRGVDEVIVATSTLVADDRIVDWCRKNNVDRYRGSPDNVLDRCYQAAIYANADIIVRLTCDCPWIDPEVVEQVLRLQKATGADYVSNIDPPSYPDGLDVECMTFAAVQAAWYEVKSPVDKDCWPQFIWRNRDRFKAANLRCPLPGLEKERWVCDTAEDLAFCQEVARRLDVDHSPPRLLDILAVLDKEPQLRDINKQWSRNERFYEGLAQERLPARTFTRSERIFEQADKLIPFGAQTFSKSHLQFPKRHSPLYVSHADGAYVFDVDGNRYVDLVSAILPVVLGHRDPDVDAAIREQLGSGISVSLATRLEVDLAVLLNKHIPCAEMVKFGKSGTDVTTAAVRLARAVTGRDHTLLSGYHGWADWSMACTDRALGIPLAVRDLSHRFTYGDRMEVIDLAGRHQPAAIIVEPNDDPDYLRWLREFCSDLGIILIFDEVITGFRYAMGGAQELFGVTPDLATFGKAMANGMPISALCGKAELMQRMAPPDNIFYSGTMFGETLSIAAAIATIKKLEANDGPAKLAALGARLAGPAWDAIEANGLQDRITLSGHFSRKIINIADDKLRTLFMAEMIQNGVLMINSHNVSLAFGASEISRVRHAWEDTCKSLRRHLDEGTLDQAVEGIVVQAAPLRATGWDYSSSPLLLEATIKLQKAGSGEILP